MSNSERKLQRQNINETKKDTEKKLNTQLGMFSLLPNECTVCQAPFDKKSKEMANTWVVVAKAEQKIVRLFCPECIQKVKEQLTNEN